MSFAIVTLLEVFLIQIAGICKIYSGCFQLNFVYGVIFSCHTLYTISSIATKSDHLVLKQWKYQIQVKQYKINPVKCL